MHSRTDCTDTGHISAYKAKSTKLIIIKYKYKYSNSFALTRWSRSTRSPNYYSIGPNK